MVLCHHFLECSNCLMVGMLVMVWPLFPQSSDGSITTALQLLAPSFSTPCFGKGRRVDEALYPLDEAVVISFLRLGPCNPIPSIRVSSCPLLPPFPKVAILSLQVRRHVLRTWSMNLMFDGPVVRWCGGLMTFLLVFFFFQLFGFLGFLV